MSTYTVVVQGVIKKEELRGLSTRSGEQSFDKRGIQSSAGRYAVRILGLYSEAVRNRFLWTLQSINGS